MAEKIESAKISVGALNTNSASLPVMKNVPSGVAQIYRAFGKGAPLERSDSARATIDIDRQDVGDFYSEDTLES